MFRADAAFSKTEIYAALEERGGKYAIRLWLSLIAYNLGRLWRRLVPPNKVENWSLTSLQQRLDIQSMLARMAKRRFGVNLRGR